MFQIKNIFPVEKQQRLVGDPRLGVAVCFEAGSWVNPSLSWDPLASSPRGRVLQRNPGLTALYGGKHSPAGDWGRKTPILQCPCKPNFFSGMEEEWLAWGGRDAWAVACRLQDFFFFVGTVGLICPELSVSEVAQPSMKEESLPCLNCSLHLVVLPLETI